MRPLDRRHRGARAGVRRQDDSPPRARKAPGLARQELGVPPGIPKVDRGHPAIRRRGRAPLPGEPRGRSRQPRDQSCRPSLRLAGDSHADRLGEGDLPRQHVLPLWRSRRLSQAHAQGKEGKRGQRPIHHDHAGGLRRDRRPRSDQDRHNGGQRHREGGPSGKASRSSTPTGTASSRSSPTQGSGRPGRHTRGSGRAWCPRGGRWSERAW